MTQPRMVGGRYELGELIGYGGMAEVHRGRDTRLNREVAIKVLRADLARDQTFLNRFRREAHSAAGLNHPSIVSVYDTGEDVGPDGTAVPFIVMEYVEGRTLRDILRAEGPLPARRAMEITADICSALDFSHRNGIIHRDIKPANVMITQSGAVKVMDFGIARAVADTSATVTQTANVIGTAQYLSPEQARGDSVDARSDVYSTGCLLYELITGVPPFQGDSPVAVAYQHVRENPVMPSSRNSDVPRALDSVVMKALAKNQLNRYQSAGDMRADLQRAIAEQPVIAEAVMTDAERTQFIARTPPPPMAPRQDIYDDEDDHRRRNALIWVAVVVALLLVIGIGSFVLFRSPSHETKMVNVASVTGELPSAAEQQLKQQGLVPQLGGDSNGPCTDNQTVQPKHVCTTNPKPNKSIPVGTTVIYTVYKQKTVTVPAVTGMDYNQASARLAKLGLVPKQKNVFSADPKGKVEKQSVEPYKTALVGSAVVLSVSTGTIKLPDVRGMNIDDARSNLPPSFQVSVHHIVTHTFKDDQIVATESPKAKKAYDPDQRISLGVYKYEQPQPSCTTPPASTPDTGLPSGLSSSGTSSSSTSSSTSDIPACSTTTPATTTPAGSSGSPAS